MTRRAGQPVGPPAWPSSRSYSPSQHLERFRGRLSGCTTKFWFLFAARRFSSGRGGKLIELMNAGTGCCQHSNEDGSTCIGHLITMSPGHLPDYSMGTQQAKLSANCSRPASSLSGRVGLATIQQLLEIPIAQAVNQKL